MNGDLKVPLVALFSCVLWRPLDMWLDNTVSLFLLRTFSIALHFSLLLVEWFCCCQTALWILHLEWAVTFCNWKFISQRQFHWALSLFNTQSRITGSCGFLRCCRYCRMCWKKKVVHFHSFTVLLSWFSFTVTKVCWYFLPLIFYLLIHQAFALLKACPTCNNWYKWRKRISTQKLVLNIRSFAKSKFLARSNMDDVSFFFLGLDNTMVDIFNW